MEWHELFPKTRQPEPSEIEAYIESPLWAEFCGWLQAAYAAGPLIQYSVCSGAPGWNVKFRKGSRAICTNYPRRGYFTCLVCIGGPGGGSGGAALARVRLVCAGAVFFRPAVQRRALAHDQRRFTRRA